MAISGITQEAIAEILRQNLTPSAHIETPERLFGRAKNLTQIERAFNSPGRQVFIFGDRGVGKSSLALTAAHLYAGSSNRPIYVLCSRTTTFSKVVQAIGNSVVSIESRMETAGQAGSIGLSIVGTGGNYSPSTAPVAQIPEPTSLNDALDIVRYVETKIDGPIVVIVDEMERLRSDDERDLFSEFIKSTPTLSGRTKFIFCGIGTTLEEILGSHPSAGRILETINLERLHYNYLWEILTTVSSKLGVEIPRDTLIRAGQISDGFPHYVHLIGESMFWSIFDDAKVITKVGERHFKAGINGALQRTEAVLRSQYDKATKKTKNTEDYEEALWALADRTSDRRQVTEVYDNSYVPLMMKRTGRAALKKGLLNQRLLALRKESHGRIVIGYGSGWFGFRENIMRGYVRLNAEQAGIQLGKSVSIG